MWRQVKDDTRDALLEAAPQLGILGEMLVYVERNPEADTEEMLVRWSDDPDYPALLQRAQKVLEIGPEELAAEFRDGADRLYENLRTNERKQELARLREAGDTEGLRAFLASKSR